jgi:hypothetical protein
MDNAELVVHIALVATASLVLAGIALVLSIPGAISGLYALVEGRESIRLDPKLREALAQRASHGHETTSTVIHEALCQYLQQSGMTDPSHWRQP